jgi:hypothetical protein
MADRTLFEILGLSFNDREANYKSVGIDSVEIDGNIISGYGVYSFFNAKSYVKSPERSEGGVIGNLDSYRTFITPRLKLEFNAMSIDTYRTLMNLIRTKNEFTVKCYDIVSNSIQTHKMYFEPDDFPEIFVQDLQTLAVLNYSVLLNGTNSEVETIDITYHKNPPTGSDVVEVVADIPKNVSVIMGEDLTTILVSETFGDTYKFKYWAENSDGTGFKYIEGNAYYVYTDITLYAIWEASA